MDRKLFLLHVKILTIVSLSCHRSNTNSGLNKYGMYGIEITLTLIIKVEIDNGSSQIGSTIKLMAQHFLDILRRQHWATLWGAFAMLTIIFNRLDIVVLGIEMTSRLRLLVMMSSYYVLLICRNALTRLYCFWLLGKRKVTNQ